MTIEGEFFRKLYKEHERTLEMIAYDRSCIYEKSDFYEEQKTRATNLQTRFKTLKAMENLVEAYPAYITEDG